MQYHGETLMIGVVFSWSGQEGLSLRHLDYEAAEILERDGLNELEKPPKPTLLLLFLMQSLGTVQAV